MHFRTAQHAQHGVSMATATHRPGCAHRHTNGLLQIWWLSRVLQMLIGDKPFLRTGLWEGQIVSGYHPVDAAPFFYRQVQERKMAHLRMNRVDASIKLDKRGLHQFITCRRPGVCQLCRNSLPHVTQHVLLLRLDSFPVLSFMGTFQAHYLMSSSQRFRSR